MNKHHSECVIDYWRSIAAEKIWLCLHRVFAIDVPADPVMCPILGRHHSKDHFY